MNRLEPNILLAVSTGVALILLVLTASAFGEPGNTIKYVVSAVVCSAIVAGLNSWMARRMGQTELHPMIRAEAPTSAVLAGLFVWLKLTEEADEEALELEQEAGV